MLCALVYVCPNGDGAMQREWRMHARCGIFLRIKLTTNDARTDLLFKSTSSMCHHFKFSHLNYVRAHSK